MDSISYIFVLAAIFSDMTLTETFNKYFKTKLILLCGVGIVATLIRHFTKPDTSFLFIFCFISCTIIVAFFLGFLDYNFYEKQAPKTILRLLESSPLKDFANNGFLKEDDNRLVGKINDFQVSLAPLTKSNRENSLLISVPLKLQEGLDEYFTHFDNYFKLKLSGNILFAEAFIGNYDKNFDFEKLNKLLRDTTQKLKDKNIQTIEVYDDK